MASAQKASISGSEVVLGPSAPVCFMRMPDGCPVEQAISRQRLRPGSGFLSVKVTTDGPTRVLQITDVKQRVRELFNSPSIRFTNLLRYNTGRHISSVTTSCSC